MKNLIYYLLLLYAFICSLSIAYFNGTGDAGDSITHYLFARYAPEHPVLYFDHWAKPLFVLLASPFAQFGFTGLKVFNSLIGLAVIFFTYKTAEHLKIRNAVLAALMVMFSPLNYILTFSGLTEPLFALFTILGIYFCSKQKYISASVLISFLPYIRSEGLIILGVFILYFFYKNMWKILPYLLFGSVMYGIAGYFVHGSFLWVFTKIPYATLSSPYGHGRLFHFVEELINVTGVPIYFLLLIGFTGLIVLFFRKKVIPEQHILLLLGFSFFFIAHSLFWYLGIFNSMGLKRVFVGIIPLMAIIALQGFNFINEPLLGSKPILKNTLQCLLVLYIIVFPFTSNPSAIQWKKDMTLSAEQKTAIKISDFIKAEHKLKLPLVFNHRFLCLTFNLDYFDPASCKQISMQSLAEMKAGDLVIWDNLYARTESRISKNTMDSLPGFKNICTYSMNEYKRDVLFSVYEKK